MFDFGTFTLVPRDYQLKAARIAAGRNILLADECGLGKTLTALLAIQQYAPDRHSQSLAVCPLRLVEQWKDEASRAGVKAFVLPYGWPITLFNKLDGLYITHYENLRNADTLMSLRAVPWDVIIVDEAHRIKNRDAVQTKAIKSLYAGRKIAITGTPMEKSPADLWSILNWLYPNSYSSYWRFVNRFIDVADTYFGKKFKGVKNEKGLAQQLATIMVRRTKQEVEPELPPKILQIVEVSMTNSQKAAYDAIDKAKDILVDVGDRIPLLVANVLSKMTKLQQISSTPRTLDIPAGSGKLDWLMDWLGDNEGVRVVMFTRFRQTAVAIAEAITSEDCDIIMGGMPVKIDGFLSGRKYHLVGTIDAMGEGLNLQIADVAIFVDLHWSTLKMTQAIDRIHRIGITGPKLIYFLLSGDIDYLIYKALDRKWSILDLVLEASKRWKEV